MIYPLTAWCVLMVAAAAPDGYSEDGAKMRRIPGMFPRPIVGRSNPAATWLVDLAEAAQTLENKPKRTDISGLFAYPRVGRGGLETQIEDSERDGSGAKRARILPVGRFHGGSSADKRGREETQLWFGPRLGKRGGSDQSPWALIDLREYPPNGRHSDAFTPRLGRESSEETTDDDDNRRL